MQALDGADMIELSEWAVRISDPLSDHFFRVSAKKSGQTVIPRLRQSCPFQYQRHKSGNEVCRGATVSSRNEV